MVWSQRHWHLVGATALFLALMVVGLAVSVFLIWHEKEQTRKALAEARTNYAQAEAQRQRAETNFREAYWTVEDLLCAFDQDRSPQPVRVAELRKWQTERALRFLARFCEDPSEDSSARLQKGAAYVHTGRVYQVLGEREKAQNAFRQAATVFDRLVQDFPDDPTYPRELATALGIVAEDLYRAGRIADANAYHCQGGSVLREAIRNHPADLETYLSLAYGLCIWFDPQFRDPTAAVALARKAVAMAPHDSDVWMVLGVANYRAGQWDDAVMALQKGFHGKIRVKSRFDLAVGWSFLAMAQWRCGRREEAMEAYQQAVRWMDSPRGRDVWDRAVRAEAATLLGIKEPPPFKVEEELPGQN
jgi:tetratricopeptide (TPR) repeat protein